MAIAQIRAQRGVSLIEALIAMAIMAFGMLAVIGVQGTLRINADISKQRGEATRLAEQNLEELRGFSTADAFDDIPLGTPSPTSVAGDNATFNMTRTVALASDGRSKSVHSLVEWTDRTGETRRVEVHDLLARVDPLLSGVVRAAKPLTAVGRKKLRHPTIPGRAHDIGGDSSIFKPVESGAVAWVFNNSTGAITHICSVELTDRSEDLESTAGCTVLSISAQLLAGEIRFNLRGSTLNLGTESAFKPAASGEVAWVIDHATQSIVRVCPVAAITQTPSLTAGMLSSGCTAVSPAVPISPFAPTDASYTLVASDSENPGWHALPATIALDGTSPFAGIATAADLICYSDAQTSAYAPATAAPAQKSIQYFCIIKPLSTDGWGARTKVQPLPFAEGGAAWATGNAAGRYRVCRYTLASTGYTENVDHPNVYAKDAPSCSPFCRKVTGNLINQNFLVIDGTKSCPTDTAADPASGDLVNSNTLQHQP